ncbi:MAG: hypothetical protein FJY97_00605 [candidate division Zixibacteria bacterium]|nr:hypothetical protein [candidate division Zixibacteria bacterium]
MFSRLICLILLGLLLGTAEPARSEQTRPATPPQSPVLPILTPHLHFGDVGIGASGALNVIIANFGDQPLQGSIAVTGPDFTAFTLPYGNSGTIDPGDSVWIQVVFSPQQPGLQTATLELTGNIDGGPFLSRSPDTAYSNFPTCLADRPLHWTSRRSAVFPALPISR